MLVRWEIVIRLRFWGLCATREVLQIKVLRALRQLFPNEERLLSCFKEGIAYAHVEGWNHNTAGPLTEKVLAELGLEPFKPFQQPFLGCRFGHFISLLRATPTLIAFALSYVLGDYRRVARSGVNFGKPVTELMIHESEDAKPVGGAKKFYLAAREFYSHMRMADLVAVGMKHHRIVLVLGAEFSYPEFSVSAQLAVKYEVPSYFWAGTDYASVIPFEIDFLSGWAPIESLVHAFRPSPRELKDAEGQLKQRVAGGRGSLSGLQDAMSGSVPPDYSRSCWLMLHDFRDAPGGGGDSVFADYPTLLEHTLKVCRRLGLTLVVKCHPGQSKRDKEILRKIIGKRPKVFLETWDYSIENIRRSDPICLLTGFGSVIVEAGYAEVPVISFSRSPYDPFNASHRVRRKGELLKLLEKAARRELPPAKVDDVIKAAAFPNWIAQMVYKRIEVPLFLLNREQWSEMKLGPYPKDLYSAVMIPATTPGPFRGLMEARIRDLKVAEALGIRMKNL